ncbi:MAG TPA: 1,4-beta-xylanase [Verrucomicrobia bacterium]|nr:1,4-beta-xylanase [Verrucomicrobiota bacterium]
MSGTKTYWAAGLAAFAALSTEAFEIDKSAMSEKYWQIWNTAEQARIDADIERNRKADAVVEIAAPAGTVVKVEQLDHAFGFGAHLFNFNQLGSDERNARHKAMFGKGGLFNQATIAFYWRPFEPVEGKMRFAAEYEDTAAYWNGKSEPWADWRWRRPASDPCVEFCEKKGVRRHGHVLGWGSDHWQTPLWYYAKGEAELPFMKGFLKEVKFKTAGGASGSRYAHDDAKFAELEKMSVKELEAKAPNFVKSLNEDWARRFRTIGEHYGDRLQSWDVCNESATDYGMGRLIPGDKITKSHYGPMPGDYAFFSFKCAEKAFPKSVKLCINDYQYGYNNAYGRQVADMIGRGAKIDMVGSQMHLFDYKQTLGIAEGKEIQTPAQVREVMGRLGAMGRPIHLSEITVTSPGDDAKGRMIQAVALYNLYRLWFSIEKMAAITMWNTVDECGAPGEPKWSGIMTREVEPKPAYYALDKLINEEWTTRTQASVKDGKIAFRGFRGNYRLSWTDADGNVQTRDVAVQ